MNCPRCGGVVLAGWDGPECLMCGELTETREPTATERSAHHRRGAQIKYGLPVKEHGTLRTYNMGCRCNECASGARKAAQKRRKRARERVEASEL